MRRPRKPTAPPSQGWPIASRHYKIKLADALKAHDEALAYGGRDGILSLENLQSAISRPYSGYHRPIERKAAALVQSVAKNHGFVDGNKRTALLLLDLLLTRSGYRIGPLPADDPDTYLENTIVRVVDGGMTFAALTQWLKDRFIRQD